MNDTSRPARPDVRPARPHFSSGPTAKRPGWTPAHLGGAVLGRSHRSKPAKERLKQAIERTRALLRVPGDYRIAIVPASDTGAMEMALWSLLGARGVDLLAWESFGRAWMTDAVKQLRLAGARVLEADYGRLPDLTRVDPDHDVVFTWNGTTSGVRVPHGDWISEARGGLTICDATSAAFAQDLPWAKLDATTFSWQKALGGEAGHGMLVLSPRAVERLTSYTPPWPLPKIFRMTKNGELMEDLFEGSTINTPSMMCVEDYLDALDWAERMGGLDALFGRAAANYAVVSEWVERTGWVEFLAQDPATRSNTSVCLAIADAALAGLEAEAAVLPKRIAALLEAEWVAYDVAGHRDAPPGLRLWCGATVDADDIGALMPWLDWAWRTISADYASAA